MDPLTMAAIGAGLGYLKGEFVDRPRENRQRKVAAETQRWSPWTGMQSGPIREADSFGSTLQGGMTGATLGQSMEASALYKDQLAKQAAANTAMNTSLMAQNSGFTGAPAVLSTDPYAAYVKPKPLSLWNQY